MGVTKKGADIINFFPLYSMRIKLGVLFTKLG
jgi:hypothetical protein